MTKSQEEQHSTHAVQRSPAEVYDQAFVPALFGPWARRIAEVAGLLAGQRVLDVACGTGALSRAAAEWVGSSGSVVGLDPNPQMLEVAARKQSSIEWKEATAESLPFADDSFDAVVSQFGMMFFEDAPGSLREMKRVLRPQGKLTVAVCDGIDHSPGYAVLTELLHRLFGHDVAQSFRAPFAMGSRDALRSLAREAGLTHATVTRYDGNLHFDSIADLVATERACAWTLGGVLDDPQFERLAREAEESLAPFVTARGTIEFAVPALVLTA